MRKLSLATLSGLAAVVALAACGGPPAEGESTSPMTLDLPRNQIPTPGNCRIVSPGQFNRTCEGIEFAAPVGTRVLYRPDDGSRRVVVCYMHTSHQAEIIGVDVFNMDTGRHLRTIQAYNEPQVSETCQGALAAAGGD